MRLLRIVESVDDDGGNAGFIENDFADDIIIEANQKIALVNATLSLKNTSLTIDGENNKIQFQFTAATGVRTAFMDSNIGFGVSAHDQASQAVVNTLNDALGCLLNIGNEPSEEVPETGTGNGFNSDIGKQWERPTTGSRTLIRWKNGSRTILEDHWTNSNLTAAPAVAAGGNYNNSTLTPVGASNETTTPTSSLYALTPWAKGCCQHFCRIRKIVAAVDGDYTTTGITLGLEGLAGAAPAPATDGACDFGLKIVFVDGGQGHPVAIKIEAGSFEGTEDDGVEIYYITENDANNPIVGLFRNFGFIQYLGYADTYFKLLIDNIGGGASPNGVAYPANRAAALVMYAAAVAGVYDATLAGDVAGTNSADKGTTEEHVLWEASENPTRGGAEPADLHPSYNFYSAKTTAGETPVSYGEIEVDFVRSTLDPWIAPPKPIHLHSNDALGAIAPAPMSNVQTTSNFIQLQQEVADYLGYFMKSQRAGVYRAPEVDFYTFEGSQSKDPNDTKAGFFYEADLPTTNQSNYYNLQVIWKSRPLDCYDGETGEQSSLLGCIPTTINSNGQIVYEAKNILPINFRNPSSFSMRNAMIRILTADGEPVIFSGVQVITVALLDG
mgnify:FL=1|tara:strand:- start:12 stop:1847 length:1836 start_codon:yes stop_codon:yes gene_type:complete